jgi:aminoglycoside phosphotransferase (APT) family kinase protein
MLVRMPSAADYAEQVKKEQQWLPRLAPLLPFPIPAPLGLGKPSEGYPWEWSVYRWLDGESAASGRIADLNSFAMSLAQFLIALQSIDAKNGPLAGPHSFYRGGSLSTYSAETREAIETLKGKIDVASAIEVWEAALATSWQRPPVWVHGDISVGNLLVKEGNLCAVIDFGQLAIGDPACDLAIAWTLFKGESRAIFRKTLSLDDGVWARSRGWALWKSLIYIVDGLTNMNFEASQSWHIINEILADHKGSDR